MQETILGGMASPAAKEPRAVLLCDISRSDIGEPRVASIAVAGTAWLSALAGLVTRHCRAFTILVVGIVTQISMDSDWLVRDVRYSVASWMVPNEMSNHSPMHEAAWASPL